LRLFHAANVKSAAALASAINDTALSAVLQFLAEVKRPTCFLLPGKSAFPMKPRFVEKVLDRGRKRESNVVTTGTASPLVPPQPTIKKLQEAARDCRACPLWKTGTQTVFGEGSRHAKVIFVGEQPGNDEDLAGKPFVGPAGKLLDKALVEAGIERDEVYVTNAVKHFKWEPKGKRRIHKKPSGREIAACRPWLEAELEVLKPKVLVCLGATAAQALLGKEFRVSQRRGEFVESPLAEHVVATVHPSSILRAPDDETRHAETARFIADLKKVAKVIHGLK
jgi:uracil-DNA glycosylase